MATMEKLEGSKVKLTIEVGADEFEKAVEKAYLKTKKNFNVPGFRKGHAPRKVIENAYGWLVFFDDAFDIAYPEVYEAAVREHEITPVDRPEISILSCEQGAPVVFTAEVAVKPEVTLGADKGIEVEKQEYNVTDEMVEAEIDKEREKIASTSEITDRPVANGDKINLDYSGSVDGVKFEGGTAEGQELTIGSGTFIPGFEEQLVGKNIGEECEINVTFPEEYHAAELAGKPATFKVTVKEIKVKELPELDDDFAKDVSEFDTLAEYKEDVKKKLTEKKEKEARTAKENAAVDKAIENAQMDIPEAMISFQSRQMVDDFARRIMQQGMTMEQYFQFTGLSEEKMMEEFKPEAEKRIRTRLTLEAIVAAENIEVSEERLDEELQKMADSYKMEVDKLKEYMGENEKKQMKEDIAIQEAVTLIANAAVEG